MTEPVHYYDPNARRTACRIKAWPSHSIAEATTASDGTIQVGHSRRAVTCPPCLEEIKREQEKRHGR